jgi:hypothetical protein
MKLNNLLYSHPKLEKLFQMLNDEPIEPAPLKPVDAIIHRHTLVNLDSNEPVFAYWKAIVPALVGLDQESWGGQDLEALKSHVADLLKEYNMSPNFIRTLPVVEYVPRREIQSD